MAIIEESMSGISKFFLIFFGALAISLVIGISFIEPPRGEVASGLVWFYMMFVVLAFSVRNVLVNLINKITTSKFIEPLLLFIGILVEINLLKFVFDHGTPLTFQLFSRNEIGMGESRSTIFGLHTGVTLSFIVALVFSWRDLFETDY